MQGLLGKPANCGRHAGCELLPGPGLTWADAPRHPGPHPSCLQRPFLPPGPYLANLRVLAMSDAKGFQVRCGCCSARPHPSWPSVCC